MLTSGYLRMAKTVAGTLLSLAATSGFCGEIKLQNPSFEQGTGGYWINIPGMATIDADTSTAGAHSLCLSPAGGKAVEAVFFAPLQKDMAYRLSFDCKGTGGENGPVLRVKAMLQGSTPVAFWTRADGSQYLNEVIPAPEWKRSEMVLGPFPEESMGKNVTKIGFYLSAAGVSGNGRLWIDNVSLATEPPAPGETSKDEHAEKKKPQPAVSPIKPDGVKDKMETVPQAYAKKPETPASRNLIRIDLPNPVRLFDQPVSMKITAPDAPEGATLKIEVTDFRGRVRASSAEDASAGFEKLISAPGYYLASVSLTKGSDIMETHSSSFLVTTPLPSDYYSTPHPAFGVWCGVTDEMLRIAGAKWTRQLFFTQFQKPDFKGDPPSAEALAAKSPVKVIRCLNVLNAFKKMVPVPRDEWNDILEKTGRDIMSRKGLVDVWETQNEPMVGENFHGKMEDVVDIIANESRLIRKLDPGTPIAGICINPMSANQYGQIIGYYQSHKMDKLVDSVMIHPYIPNAAAPDSSGYPEMLARLSRDLKEITGREVPIYISEIGYSTKPGGEVSELEQAAYMARVALINRGFPNLKACVWHCGLWNDATARRELDYGILRPHPKNSPIREPKPAFAAWATMSRQTYNADYLGELEFGRGSKVMLFSRNGLPLLVAYSLSKTPKTLKIPLSGGKATVTDLCGSSSEEMTEKGILTVSVDEAPVYIAGYGREDISRLRGLKVEFSPQSLKAKPGEETTLSLKGESLAVDGGSLKVETPAGWSSAVEGGKDAWRIKLKIPENAEPGEQSIFIHLLKDGESRCIWNREITIQAPIEIANLKYVPVSNSTSRLDFMPKSALKDARFNLSVFEDAKRTASGEFQVNKASSVVIPQPAFGRPHQYNAEIDDGIRKPWKVQLPALNRLPVSRGLSKFVLENGEPSRGSVKGDFDRPQGAVTLGWTERALIVGVETKDRWHVVAETPEAMWCADSLQMAVSVAQSEMIHPNNDGLGETLFTSFGLMPAAGGVCKSWVWASSNRNIAEVSNPLPDVKATWVRDGDTTKYAAEIPWKSLNVKNPRPGLELKLSLLVNDADESKQRHWMEWYGGIATGMDPSLYGDAVLSDGIQATGR